MNNLGIVTTAFFTGSAPHVPPGKGKGKGKGKGSSRETRSLQDDSEINVSVHRFSIDDP